MPIVNAKKQVTHKITWLDCKTVASLREIAFGAIKKFIVTFPFYRRLPINVQ
jgi:hypothetical protein